MSNYRKRPLGQARLHTFEDFYDKLAVNGLVPPQSVDVERSVLGSMMISVIAVREAIEEIGTFDLAIEGSPFYREQHTWIYQAIVKLDRAGIEIDLATVANEIQEMGKHDTIGGAAYLVELTTEVITTANVRAHCRIIRSKHLMRETIRSAEEIKLRAFIGEESPDDLVTEAERAFARLAEARFKNSGFRQGSDVGFEEAQRLETMKDRGAGLTGAPTGLVELDELTCGWQPDLIYLGARPSQGKTACGIHFGKTVALHPDPQLRGTVAFFSLEMPSAQVIIRLVASMAGIDMQRIRKGQMSSTEWSMFIRALAQLKEAGTFLIDDTPAISVDEMRSKLRSLRARLAAEKRPPLRLVIIDYVQLVTLPGNWENERVMLSEVSKALARLKKEFKTPIIALAQLNREVDMRRDNRPQQSDLGGSGQLERDADVILFIFRPWTYGILTYEKTGESTEYIAELILAKQRNGPIDDIKVHFNKHTQQFSNKEQAIFENTQQEAF